MTTMVDGLLAENLNCVSIIESIEHLVVASNIFKLGDN